MMVNCGINSTILEVNFPNTKGLEKKVIERIF
jgi:hypothetical protein